jgi:transposase
VSKASPVTVGDVTYPSQRAAAKALGIALSTVTNRIRKGSKSRRSTEAPPRKAIEGDEAKDKWLNRLHQAARTRRALAEGAV